MSQEGHVFCNREIRSIAEWQRAIGALGFSLTLASDRDPIRASGHLPAWLDGREAGFECGPIDVGEVLKTYDDVDLGGPWTFAMVFYYGRPVACVGAWLAIAALASATDGTAYDPQSDTVLNARAAADYARDGLNSLPEVEKMLGER